MSRAALFLPLMLVGCATTSTADLRKTPIDATYQSARAPAEIAACLAEHLTRAGAPSIYQSGQDMAVAFITGGNTLLLVTITPAGSITVRRAVSITPFRAQTKACL